MALDPSASPSPDGEADALQGQASLPVEPEVPLGKRVFRGALFLVLLLTGALLAHHRHPAMKGVFLGPSADGEASAPASTSPR